MKNMDFRAWDAKKKEMFYVVSINLELERVYQTWNKNGKNLYVPSEDAVIMQYAGKMDQNGTKVYQGDVIMVKRRTFDEDDDGLYPYLIKWDDYYSGYSPFQDDYSYPDEGFEIVGNIFEDEEYACLQEEYFKEWSRDDE